MSRSPHSTSTGVALRRSVATLCAVILLAAPAAWAQGDSVAGPLFQPNEDWRARGLAYIDLPLRIRARFDASYSKYGSVADHLAAPIAADVGPGLRYDRHIESRIALTRPVYRGVELEVVWQTRNRIESGDPMAFGRQVVGAMIRITP